MASIVTPKKGSKDNDFNYHFLWECYASNPTNKVDFAVVAEKMGVTKKAAEGRLYRLKKTMETKPFDKSPESSGSPKPPKKKPATTSTQATPKLEEGEFKKEHHEDNPKLELKHQDRMKGTIKSEHELLKDQKESKDVLAIIKTETQEDSDQYEPIAEEDFA
ncbi:hypothetical protein N7495_005767 [Penicillium taxi]|uniref:uncharacterized protein n=1 Tax=Penicillium taxi TaxID=168475 RepID=UPI0025455EAF|nr:uncharacterized protein N7495_005767 [Penicillium taxi]KAJ5894076.1 hypothetical protein N7495_005767 [Penicillium taxi]